MKVHENSSLASQNLLFQGIVENIDIIMDGKTNVLKLVTKPEIKKITISGNGPEQRIQHLIASNTHTELDSLSNTRMNYIEAKIISLRENAIVNLQSCEDSINVLVKETVEIIGILNLGSDILFTAKEDDLLQVLQISGKIFATKDAIVCKIKCQKLNISGCVEKLGAFETDVKTTTIEEKGKIKCIEKCDIQSEWLTNNGNIEDCPKLDIYSWGNIL